jgi:hypothetical protein
MALPKLDAVKDAFAETLELALVDKLAVELPVALSLTSILMLILAP